MSRRRARAQQGQVFAIYTEWLAGQASPGEIQNWLNRATRSLSAEDTLLLQEFRTQLTSTGTDQAWRNLGNHAVFQHLTETGTSQSGSSQTMAVLAAVSGATVTAAVLPFIQSLATQAGQRAFEAARATTRRMIGQRGSAPDIHSGRTKILVEETSAGVRFLVPPRLPDEALAALAETDLEALAAPDQHGTTVTIFWDEDLRQWCRRMSRDTIVGTRVVC